MSRRPVTLLLLMLAPAAATAAPCISRNTLEGYLRNQASPLAAHVDGFFASAQQWNVDPRLVVAVGGAESSFGKNGLCATQRHNAWGWGGGYPNCFSYPTWDAAIDAVTSGLRRLYLDLGLTTIPAIAAKYCATGCENWIPNVTLFYEVELDGDPDNLEYMGDCSACLRLGGRVRSIASGLNVRSIPAGMVLRQLPLGAVGTITGGPQSASLNDSLYVWWAITWDDGLTAGWSVEDYLACAASIPTPTPAPPSSTPTTTPTPTATPTVCAGDCNGDGTVTINDILAMVNVALGRLDVAACPPGDVNHDGSITIAEIVLALTNAFQGCPSG